MFIDLPLPIQSENPEFPETPEERATRARVLQKAMAARASQPQGGMVGGVYVPPSVLSRIAAFGSNIGSDLAGDRAAQLESQANRQRQQAEAAWMEQMGAPYEQVVPSATGVSGEETRKPLLGSALRAEKMRRLAAAPPSMQKDARAELMKLYTQGPDAPKAIGGNAYMDPETGEVKRLPADETVVEQKWFDLNTRRQDAEARAEDRKAQLADRAQARAEANDLRRQQMELQREITRMRGDTAREVAETKGVGGQKPSAAAEKAIHGANAGIANIDDALDIMKTPEAKKAFGLQYALPGGELLGQYNDPKGTVARAVVSNIGSLKLHDRSGAAVTVSEFPRLAPFIPNVRDKPEVIVSKLEQLKREYERMQKEWMTPIGQGRPVAPAARPAAGSSIPTAAPPAAPKPAKSAADYLKDAGG